MRNYVDLNRLFNRDRKMLSIVFCVLIVSVLTLTVVYAALLTTLNINGQAEVSAASWDIYLDNIQLNSSSATTNVPTITDKTTASFSTTLSKPGDFYEFTIDVVNNGSIDAMINSVTKTPELSDTQKKYLSYVVEYQNGESITTKQLVAKKSFVRLKVKLEFRKDITASDLPTTSEILNLAFTVNYVQSDETGTNVEDNGIKKVLDIISGNLETVGSEICIGEECFYVISSDDDSVKLFAKYNLYVGGKHENGTWTAYGEEATGIQDSTMLGWKSSGNPYNGTTAFSSSYYWEGESEGTYVYNSNSILYNYVENYKTYLESFGVNIEEARLIKNDELEALGCSIEGSWCGDAPKWLYSTSYWTGCVYVGDVIREVYSDGGFGAESYPYDYNSNFGVRPVIEILKSEF